LDNPVNIAISFAFLILVVGASFYYVSATHPKQPWLGIEGSNVTPAIAQTLGLQEPRGFVIFSVESGSPAESAGLKGGDRVVVIDGRPVVLGGDIIIAIDNTQIHGAEDIQALLAGKTIGDSVHFTVIRGKTVHTINVILGSR
jgi:S1-C subfamily serine protease